MPTQAELKHARMISDAIVDKLPAQVIETTPGELTEALKQFCGTLSGEAPEFTPVVSDWHGLHGFCNLTVATHIAENGGSAVPGWTIWEWKGVFWTAEFHLCWRSPLGTIIDVTPKPDGETSILFVPDTTYPEDFDFTKRPRNVRQRIRQAADKQPEIDRLIEKLNPTQRVYEENRAQKAGLSLGSWIARKIEDDPIIELIDQTITACNEHEEYEDSKREGQYIRADQKLRDLIMRRQRRMERLKTVMAAESRTAETPL